MLKLRGSAIRSGNHSVKSIDLEPITATAVVDVIGNQVKIDLLDFDCEIVSLLTGTSYYVN